MKRLLNNYFAEKLLREPKPKYPAGLGLANSVSDLEDAVNGIHAFRYQVDGKNARAAGSGKTAPVIFGLGIAACIAVLVLSMPRPIVSENTAYTRVRLRQAVAQAAEQMNTRETFPKGIRKINEFFVQ